MYFLASNFIQINKKMTELNFQRSNSSLNKTTNREQKKTFGITNEAINRKKKGLLNYDLEKNELTWKPNDNSTEKILIQKNNIKKTYKKENEGNEYLRIELEKTELNKPENYIFCFQGEDNTMIRDKYFNLLEDDIFPYYKNELKSLPIQSQKKISLILNNKYLSKLFFQLYPRFTTNLEKVWNYLRSRYPEFMQINLYTNKIQLSRDEELLTYAKNTYNINRLLSADDTIKNSYISSKKNFDNENYWEEYIEKQRGEKNYLFGGYKEIINNNNDNDTKNKNSTKLMEDLEKDKYYFDPYETNYLYHYTSLSKMNEMKTKQEYAKNLISLLNNYSINKINGVHFFAAQTEKFSFDKNNYNNESQNKVDNVLFNKGKKTNNIMNKLNDMKKEYENSKQDEDNSYKDTMIQIKNENYKIYLQYICFRQIEKKISKMHIEEILEELQLIKDLICFIYEDLTNFSHFKEKYKDKDIEAKNKKYKENKKQIEELIKIFKQKSKDPSFQIINGLIKNVENYYKYLDISFKL